MECHQWLLDLASRLATVGGIGFDDIMANAGFPTRDPIMGVIISPSVPAPTAVRLSSSFELDAQGRLAKAIEIVNPTPTTIDFDTEDSATGGTPGDGRKWIIHQWRRSDGTWEVPDPESFRVDRKPPSLRLVLNANEPFVDDDEFIVLPKSDESNEITVLYSTDRDKLEGPSPEGRDLRGLVWPTGEVAPGTVVQRTIYARAIDLAYNMSPVVSGTITIDRSAPNGTLNAPSFVVGSRVTTTSIPLKVGGAAKDTGSGVATTLQEAVGTGAFSSISSSGSAAISQIRNVKPTVPRTYRIRGSDRLDHVGGWTIGPSLRPYLRDETSASIVYGTGWRRLKASPAIGADVMRSAKAGARLDFRFSGRAVAVVAPRRSSLGRAKVYLDGKYVTTIDLRASARYSQRVVFAGKWSSPGSHRLTLKVVASSGRPFDLDAIAVVP